MNNNKVVLGLVQMGMDSDPRSNLRKAAAMVEEAAGRGAQIVCLPELFATRYFPQYDIASDAERMDVPHDTIPGAMSDALSAMAKENGVVLVGGSLYERAGERFFNTALVHGEDGGLLGKYRKTHIPHDEDFYEQSYFDRGDTGFQVVDTPLGRISPLICFDQWFPEAARACALAGAQMLFYPTAIGRADGIEQWEGDWQQAWENVMRGHAIANSVVVAAVNRAGREDEMEFWGGSFVIDAFGRTVARAGEGEEIVLAKVDLEHGRLIREGWGFFRNRRPECYGRITERGSI
jgi:agmatine deiminase